MLTPATVIENTQAPTASQKKTATQHGTDEGNFRGKENFFQKYGSERNELR
jgi:hypothetical protein